MPGPRRADQVRYLNWAVSGISRILLTLQISAAVAKTTGLLAVENEPGKVVVYDLATVAKLDEFVFSSPVSLARFSADGKRLFILTANQTIYFLDVSDLQKRPAAAASGR